jgi:integrase
MLAMEKLRAAAVLGQSYQPKATMPTAPTFSAVAREALTLYTATNSLRPATLAHHESFLAQHLLPYFGAKPVTETVFNRLEMRRFIANRREALKDSTLSVSLVTLRVILDHAVELGLLPTNPIRGGERLWRPEAEDPVDPFTAAEIRTILTVARAVQPDFGVLLQVLAQTGARPGEGLGLRRCDIDLQRGEAHIQGTWSRNRRGPTKNRHSTRVVSLLWPVLEDRRVWRPADAGSETRRVLHGIRTLKIIGTDPESPLFPSTTNPAQPMSAGSFDRLWHHVLRKGQVRYRKPHTLRHSFASLLLSRGANLLAIQKAGGCKSATILLQTYAKWIEEADTAGTPASTAISTELAKTADVPR